MLSNVHLMPMIEVEAINKALLIIMSTYVIRSHICLAIVCQWKTDRWLDKSVAQ